MSTGSRPLGEMEGSTLADKYRLTSLLGSGGMGYVYQAEQLGLGRSVAVKILRKERLATGLDRFRIEALAASRINHPNAVAIYDFGITPSGTPFLVMEHLRGKTLAALIEEEPFDPSKVVAIGAQILSALAEAHACGVVHCDLTSNNVIVERLRDGEYFAKVIDFGLARAFGGAGSGTDVVGTPEYMAPEQIRGEALGPPADLYAMGVLLYEMLVGRTPFAGAAVPVILEGHLRASPMAPHEIVALCPVELGNLILWALKKDPAQRPEDARTLRDQLLSVLSSENAVVRCPTCGERAAGTPRFCSACGAELHPVTAAALARRRAASPSTELAMGSRRLGAAELGSARGSRSTRLSCEFGPNVSTMVGREDEIERVLAFCRGKTPSETLAIIGPTGNGKARLLLEAGHHLERELPIFVGAADPSRLKTPWYPVLTVLQAVLEIQNKVTLENLGQAVARCGLPSRDVPGLAEIFGISGPAGCLELAVRRREAHAAALRALLSVKRRFPRSVLCFADVHDYDQPSRRVVAALSEAVGGSGARMVVTATGEAEVPHMAEVIALEGLSPERAHELAVALAGVAAAVPSADTVHAITAGSPAAIEQLAGWVLMGNSAVAVPALLVDLVSMRVHRMPAAARRVLQAAAIHGNVVPRWLVEATLGGAPLVALAEPGWTGLLVMEEAEVTIPSKVVVDVISACTPADVKRTLHTRAFEALRDKAPPGTVGHHAAHAKKLEEAFGYFIQAGDDAVARFDDAGASVWYGRALAMARELHAKGQDAASRRFVATACRLADVLRCTGHVGLATGVLDEAELFDPDDAHAADMARTRGRIAIASNDADSAIDHLQRAIGLGMRAGDRDFLCETYIDLARALDGVARPDEAIDELAQAVDVITAGQGLPVGDAPEKMWYLGLNLAERLLHRQQATRARDVAVASLEQAGRAGSARGRARLSALLSRIYDSLGEHAVALRHRANAIDLMRQLGDRRSTAELLIDNARRAPGRSGAQQQMFPPAEDWTTDPARGMRLAGKLAAEVGWKEGVALSKRSR